MAPSKAMRKILILILLLSILYNILKTDNCLMMIKSKWSQSISIKYIQSNESNKVSQTYDKLFNVDVLKIGENATSEILATHIPMPVYLKGKKLDFHEVFEPRVVGLPSDIAKTVSDGKKSKVILLWTPWNSIKNTFNYYFFQSGNKTFTKYNCPNSHCFVTFKKKYLQKADAVLFHFIDVKPHDLPATRSPNQVWILYNMEPPWLVNRQMYSQFHMLENVFNWTMSYRRNSDVLVRYGFIENSKEQTQVVFQKKTRNVVWFVSDCRTDSRREEYVSELKKYIDVDVYGRCGDHNCFPSQSYSCYNDVLKNYRFYLSFENAICKDYVTEKFFNIFNFDTVAVVFGGADYTDIAPKETFINAMDYPQPQTLAKTLMSIANNESVYNAFIANKRKFKAYLDPWMCRLCNKLHSPSKPAIVTDVKKWLIDDSTCKRWANRNQTFVMSVLQ